jgi:phage shock protein E
MVHSWGFFCFAPSSPKRNNFKNIYMLNFLKKLLGGGPSADFAQLVSSGAKIIDVRTPGEYQNGHIPGSINIPLNELPGKLKQLNKSTPIITCCASGMRSGSAKRMLLANGFAEVHNGGGWMSLQQSL